MMTCYGFHLAKRVCHRATDRLRQIPWSSYREKAQALTCPDWLKQTGGSVNRQLASRAYLLPLALLLAFWPVWRWYVLRITDGSDEPWGVIALFAAGGFLWQVRKEIRMTPGGLWVAGGFLTTYILAFSVLPPLVRAGLALLTLAALTGTLLRHPAIWGLFVLSLPIIASMQFYLGPPLRLFTANLAHAGLYLTGCEVTLQGTQLLWQGQIVGVDAPCSGVKMLWTGMLLVMILAALHRLNWPRTLLAAGLGVVLILFGNVLRAMLLFTKESGMVSLPDWTHEGIGLLVFAGMVVLLTLWFRRFPHQTTEAPTATFSWDQIRTSSCTVALLAFLAALSPLAMPPASSQPELADFPGWPVKWREHWLEEVPLSDQEAAFAKQFPGKVGVFSAGPNKIVVRWVTRPTRKLHSSSDCLRASGYVIEQERPGVFIARGPEGVFLVEEEIYEQGILGDGSFDEVSFWFWNAFFAKTTGPWWAVTAIQPLDAGA